MSERIAITDVGITLYHALPNAVSGFKKLISIISVPAFGAEPGQLEVTVLDSPVKQYEADRAELPTMTFGYNYTEANHAKLVALAGTQQAYLTVFQDGSGYKAIGTATAFTTGQSRGSVTEGSFSVIATSIEWLTKTQVDALLVSA